MTTTYRLFDAADYLDDNEVIAEYVCAAAESSDPGLLLAALGDVARVRSIARVAKAIGFGR